ncbi:fer2 super family protein [Perkinsela sp. CCAP 1560/4]|nr:fer2 super family protein [Perkinsela sp. CCAP 1560/4]|eukprot:KNH06803.1 fer2 super family protein [Perkinsela sp. CCAP 1560/4]
MWSTVAMPIAGRRATAFLTVQLSRYSVNTSDTTKHIKMRWKGKGLPEREVKANVGQTLLEVSRANDIYLEAACEGSLACSTCHCILDEKTYSVANPPKDAEEDLLDLAFDLRPTSRLGCQVVVSEKMDNALIELPSATRNMAVDGYVPPAH